MLTITHRYRIYPDAAQEQQLIEWMDTCRGAYNYARREIKDWCDSRKCLVDRCSIEKEYILSPDLKFSHEIQQLNNLPKAKKEFPKLSEVPSQVLQQTIKQLPVGWKYFQERGFGFPRFKKYGQFKSLLFPQFQKNPVTNLLMKLPKLGEISINLHRPISTGFCPECGGEVKKDLNVRVHDCPHCGYKTDRDVAAGQNIRNRGIKLISTVGQTGIESACADDLPGTGSTQSGQVSQPPERGRRGKTRKPKK